MRTKDAEKDYRYLPDADLPPILLSDEFIQKARADIPPLPEYLMSILLGPPHNLGIKMAKRLSVIPDELTYYNAVLERARIIDGSIVYNW